MIRLKQKKAEEEKKVASEATATTASSSSVLDTNGAIVETAEAASSGGGLKLLGIGGKGARTGAGATKAVGKKRTPGEIRIQKGLFDCIAFVLDNRIM